MWTKHGFLSAIPTKKLNLEGKMINLFYFLEYKH